MQILRRNRPAFTILELLLAGALLAIITGVVSQVVFFNAQTVHRNVNVTSVNDNIRYVINVLEKEIRTADPSTISVSNSDTTLSFKNQEGEDITYTINSDEELQKTVEGETYQITNSNVLRIKTLRFSIAPSTTTRATDPQPVKLTTYAEVEIAANNERRGSALDNIPIQTTTVLRNFNKDFLDN